MRCDIFCRVVDNFGDIGVSWRLARQLADEYGWRMRLVVDDLASFQRIAPEIQTDKHKQWCGVTEILHWNGAPILEFADVVIEAFGCELPASYVAQMAAQSPPPVWLNLEYLSAEPWVAAHHLLPSPHPQLPITKRFFFPGVVSGTGGLLREKTVALPSAAANTGRKIFMFGYDLPASVILVEAIDAALGVASITVPEGALATRLMGRRLGKLVVAPMVSQTAFDQMLVEHDVLFVRGEDSLVRALWSAKPLVWQIYPQSAGAHWQKLEAFLGWYQTDLGAAAAQAQTRLWRLRNGAAGVPPGSNAASAAAEAWWGYLAHLPEIADHAWQRAARLMQQPDLAANLVALVEKNAKTP